jgi:hypothetical protein
MRRDQLEHAIRTACQIIERPEVIMFGSQAILGSFREDEPPADATMSVEVDILPIADSNDETARLADLIEGVAGEFSTFEELHGFGIDGVDLEMSALLDRRRDRLVQVQNANTAAPTRQPPFTGWCLDKEDLCVAKLCAFREKGSQLRCSPVGGRSARDAASRSCHSHRWARARLDSLEEFVEHVKALDGIWVTTLAEIAEHTERLAPTPRRHTRFEATGFPDAPAQACGVPVGTPEAVRSGITPQAMKGQR